MFYFNLLSFLSFCHEEFYQKHHRLSLSFVMKIKITSLSCQTKVKCCSWCIKVNVNAVNKRKSWIFTFKMLKCLKLKWQKVDWLNQSSTSNSKLYFRESKHRKWCKLQDKQAHTQSNMPRISRLWAVEDMASHHAQERTENIV